MQAAIPSETLATSAAQMIDPWKRRSSTPRGDYRVFRVREDISLSPATGEEFSFYVIESNAWVNIIPVTPEGRIIMIRQYRHGIRSSTLEVPGGLVDDGETPREAAIREMSEETGYTSDDVVSLGAVAPNPAIQENRCYTFLARNATLQHRQHLDGAEIIDVLEIDQEEIPALIRSGEISHALVVAAFHLFHIYGNGS